MQEMVGISTLSRISMRGRLTVLIAAAMLPLAVFIFFSIASDYEHTLSDARRGVLQSANLAATRQSEIFSVSMIVLDTVRRAAAVAAGSGPDCEVILTRVEEGNPNFLSVFVADPNGTITCHGAKPMHQRSVDPDFVHRILEPETADFVVGDFIVGPMIAQPAMPVAMPLRDAYGRKTGVLMALLNLETLPMAAETVSVGGRRTIALIQPAIGRVLTQFPKPDFAYGTIFADHPLMQAMRASPAGGVTEGEGFTGKSRIFGFAPVEGAETAGLMIAVGESRSFLLSPVRSMALRRVAVGATIFLAIMGVVWWLGERLQLQPVARLTHVAARIGSGDFAVRSRLDRWQSPELRGLGVALDRMAGRLEAGRKAEQAVAASEAQYRLLAENTADLITRVDADGLRTFASPSSFEVTGYRPEELVGMRPHDAIHPDDLGQIADMMHDLRAGRRVTGVQYRMRHRDGHYIWVEANGRPIDDGHVVFAIRDVSQRKRMEEDLAKANRQLAALASTDGLTGLLNRRSFDVFLADAFALALAEKRDLSLLMIDVDRFKGFNDLYGHTTGDECLRQVALGLRSVLRRPGIAVARYGGEEFAVILPDTPLSIAVQEAEALRFAMQRLGLKNESSEHGIITISVGVGTLPGGHAEGDVIDLVRKADRALYAAKAGGRNRTEFSLADPVDIDRALKA